MGLDLPARLSAAAGAQGRASSGRKRNTWGGGFQRSTRPRSVLSPPSAFLWPGVPPAAAPLRDAVARPAEAPCRRDGRAAAGLVGRGGKASAEGPAAVAGRRLEGSTAAWGLRGGTPACPGTPPRSRGGGWPARQAPLVSDAACACGARPVSALEPRRT